MKNIEIERKFLATLPDLPADGIEHILQGYLPGGVRIRAVTPIPAASAPVGWITIKGPPLDAAKTTRSEFEYEIPYRDALEIIGLLCECSLRKTRHTYRGDRSSGVPLWHTWQVDVFEGENEGLILAEVELESADQAVVAPLWLGEEVTHDPAFTNLNLARHPFGGWPKQ